MRRTWISALIVLAAAAVWALPPAARTNWDSLLFFKGRTASGNEAVQGVRVPSGHAREQFWKALVLYEAGDFAGAAAVLDVRMGAVGGLEVQLAASTYLAQGNYPAAIDIWRSLGSVTRLLAVAEFASEAGDRVGASAAYQAAYDLDPIQTTSLFANYLITEMEDPAAAETLLRNALDLSSNNRFTPYWWQRLARLLESQGRWAEAAEAYQAVIEKHHLMYAEDQQLYRRYLDLAWAYHQAGMDSQALEALRRSISERPQDVTSLETFWLRAGQIYEGAGRISEAQDAYRQVLDRFPHNSAAQEGLQRLSEPDDENGS
jgi:tetratricopeptide (TPR) repeat protein